MDDSWRYRLVLDGLRTQTVRPAKELFEGYCLKIGVAGESARAMFGMLINDLLLDDLIIDSMDPDPAERSFPWMDISLTSKGREWLDTIGRADED